MSQIGWTEIDRRVQKIFGPHAIATPFMRHRTDHGHAPRVEATNNNYPGQLCRRVSRDVIQIHGISTPVTATNEHEISIHDTLDSTQASPL